MEASTANEQPVSQVISAARAKKPHYQANYCSVFSQTSGSPFWLFSLKGSVPEWGGGSDDGWNTNCSITSFQSEHRDDGNWLRLFDIWTHWYDNINCCLGFRWFSWTNASGDDVSFLWRQSLWWPTVLQRYQCTYRKLFSPLHTHTSRPQVNGSEKVTHRIQLKSFIFLTSGVSVAKRAAGGGNKRGQNAAGWRCEPAQFISLFWMWKDPFTKQEKAQTLRAI